MSEADSHAVGAHKSCPHCGHLLRYDTESQKLKCTACNLYTELSYYDAEPEAAETGMISVLEYRCPQCGAAVHTTGTNLISYCNHCGSEVLFTQRMTETRRPDWIVPFRISREQCEEIYDQHMKKAVFASAKARQAVDARHFQPVYVPFFLYEETLDQNVRLIFDETCDGPVYTYSKELKCRITAGPEVQCAASRMDPVLADRLSFSVEGKKPFSPAYLCGFYAEAPDVQPDEAGRCRLDEYLKRYLHHRAQIQQINGANNRVSKVELPEEITRQKQLILLPVWLLGEKQGERMLYTAINGADGSIVCETPIQHHKVYALGAVLGAVLAACFMLLSSAVILRAKLVAGLLAVLTAACYYVVEGTLWLQKQQDEGLKLYRQQRICKHLSREELLVVAKQQKLATNLRKRLGIWALWALPILLVGQTPAAIANHIALPVMAGFYLLDSGVKTQYPTDHWKELLSVCVLSVVLYVTSLLNPLCHMLFATPNDAAMVAMLGGLIATVEATVGILACRKETRGGAYTPSEWCVRYLPLLLSTGVALMMLIGLSQRHNANMLVAGLVADNGWLAPFLCIAAAESVYSGALEDTATKTKPLSAKALCGVLAALGLVMFVFSAQWFYYSAAIGLIALMVFLTARLTQRHNRFVTRPMPDFGAGKEAAQ